MGRPSVDQDKVLFIDKLKELGGTSGNVSLRASLNWEEDRYWRTHGLLSDEGVILRGRGKGGSVLIVSQLNDAKTDDKSGLANLPTSSRYRELDLYEPTKSTLEGTWVKERAFDDHLVEVTALPGRRSTGGTWTRPDISVLATKAYPYLPDRLFEVITFEIKAADAIDVTAVFEALSHAQFATQSYAFFATNGLDLEACCPDTQRIFSLASQHGVGIVVAANVKDYSSWDERVRPRRNIPDPEQTNLFISTCFSEAAKSRVVKWHK